MRSFTWQSLPSERVNDQISRRMIVGEKEMLIRWEFVKGTRVARHSHPHEQIAMMVSGRLRLAVGENETIMGPGDIVVIPPGTPHEGEALEETVVIDVFSPPREDFLSGELPDYLK